jgi:hypothetical protein
MNLIDLLKHKHSSQGQSHHLQSIWGVDVHHEMVSGNTPRINGSATSFARK